MPSPISRTRVPSRSVALLVETSNHYGRELLHGIRDWVRQHGPWTLHLTAQGRGGTPPPWLAQWQGHGIIARIETPVIEAAVRAVGVPVVNVSAAGLAPEFPRITSDSAALTDLAIRHLRERGFRQFAFCGEARLAWSRTHEANFVRQLSALGHTCAVFPSEEADFADRRREWRKLARWIESLPRPVGVMACYDVRGQLVLDVCRELGVKIPDEVAVIGQHNDELLCNLCDPPLSSVIPNPRRSGWEAADLLDRLLRGRKARKLTVEIPPLGVATRQSTDVVAVADRQIAAAMRFIREHAGENIGVTDVLRAVPMSRTLLERKFKQFLGFTPYEQIQRTRLERARDLLTSTDLAVGEIASRAGFSSPEYLSAAFKAGTGLSPREYRRAHRHGPAADARSGA
jgi:LacI family transcriptional regulator